MIALHDGWSCKTRRGAHLDAFDLRDHIDTLTEDYAAGTEEAFSRFDSGEHILGLIKSPGTGIKVVAGNGFLEANPSTVQLVDAMALPWADIPNQNNRDLLDGWLSKARRARS